MSASPLGSPRRSSAWHGRLTPTATRTSARPNRSTAGTAFRAYINGNAYEAQNGYDVGTQVYGVGWMEYTTPQAGHSCSGWGPATGRFGNLEQLVGGSWHVASNGYRWGTLDCWNTGEIDTYGNYSVSQK